MVRPPPAPAVPGVAPGAATPALGAYGLALGGVDHRPDLFVPAVGWPLVRIDQRVGAGAGEPSGIDGDRLAVGLDGGGGLVVDRWAATATYTVDPPLSMEAIAHPFLAPVGATFAWWAGREAFHAGAFVAGGKAWAVLGQKGAGKSSTLAWLALRDVAIVSDDLLVVDGGVALTGPRSLDLRHATADRFGVGEPLDGVGGRERWRLRLGPAPSEVPIGGWIELAWGAAVALEPIPLASRLERLAPHRSLLVAPRQPLALLDVLALPAWRLTRPPDWSALPDAMGLLLDAVGGGSTRSVPEAAPS